MNKMNLHDLYIPAKLAASMNEALQAKMNAFSGSDSNLIPIREELLVELFLLSGAILREQVQKMNGNIGEGDGALETGIKYIDNQSFNGGLPRSIVEACESGGENLIRAILNYMNLSLKEVASRYGGKSGAANLANFMAKSNAELAAMRDSTLRRIAGALECPEDWLFEVRDFGQAELKEYQGEE